MLLLSIGGFGGWTMRGELQTAPEGVAALAQEANASYNVYAPDKVRPVEVRATDSAEVRYWEEAEDVHDALALALRLWGEHRESAGLPKWNVVGLEVVDRDTHRRRGDGAALLSPGVRPF